MELSIIIVNYNTSELLHKCLNKVYKSLSFGKIEKESEVIVVDNASSDDSVPMAEKNFPEVIIIKNSKNLGFAKANNQALRQARGKYILLLNSDTEIDKDALTGLLDEIKKKQGVGVVGGKLLNPDGSVQASAGFLPSLSKVFFWMFFIDDIPLLCRLIKPYHIQDKKFYQKKADVDWVTGACFMIKREVIETVGYMDENIFMYGEELEWCYRIRKAGFSVIYTPKVCLLHHKGASTKDTEGGIIEEFKSILYLYRKHKPSWQYPAVYLFLKLGALLRIVAFGIIGRYPGRLSLYAKAFKLA